MLTLSLENLLRGEYELLHNLRIILSSSITSHSSRKSGAFALSGDKLISEKATSCHWQTHTACWCWTQHFKNTDWLCCLLHIGLQIWLKIILLFPENNLMLRSNSFQQITRINQFFCTGTCFHRVNWKKPQISAGIFTKRVFHSIKNSLQHLWASYSLKRFITYHMYIYIMQHMTWLTLNS